MSTPHTEITLANLGGGALMESATLELRKICENIADPNFPTDAKRKLQITIEIKPDLKGQMAALTYDVKSVMPGPESGKAMAYIAMSPTSREISLFEVESHPPLFDIQPSIPNVTELSTKHA